jgi:hypothetical protein
MRSWKTGRIIRLLIAIGCFVMAGLSFFGVVSKDDPGEQRLFAGLWALAGVLWLLRISLQGGKRPPDDRPGDS